MDLDTWLVYTLAVLGISVLPGPNSLLVLAHGALHGRRCASATIVGGALGFTAVIGLSMAGIGALLQAFSQALLVMKCLGGAYLVWLGVQLWRAPGLALAAVNGAPAGPAAASAGACFRQGLLTAVSNPKVLLFYAAFLPQFMSPTRPLLPQFLVMAATFTVVEGVIEFALASMAQRVRPVLARYSRGFNRACGSMFVAIGCAMPFSR